MKVLIKVHAQVQCGSNVLATEARGMQNMRHQSGAVLGDTLSITHGIQGGNEVLAESTSYETTLHESDLMPDVTERGRNTRVVHSSGMRIKEGSIARRHGRKGKGGRMELRTVLWHQS